MSDIIIGFSKNLQSHDTDSGVSQAHPQITKSYWLSNTHPQNTPFEHGYSQKCCGQTLFIWRKWQLTWMCGRLFKSFQNCSKDFSRLRSSSNFRNFTIFFASCAESDEIFHCGLVYILVVLCKQSRIASCIPRHLIGGQLYGLRTGFSGQAKSPIVTIQYTVLFFHNLLFTYFVSFPHVKIKYQT